MNNALMFSSATDEWETPQAFFDALDAEFHFTLDVAASAVNRKCYLYYGPDHLEPQYRDGLANDWWMGRPGEVAWCNPPYSRGLQGKFIAKAAHEARKGAGGLLTVVMLLPARTDTKAFHVHIYDARTWQPRTGIEIRLILGRLKFGGGANSAPFPSMVVIFRSVREER